MPPAFSGLLLPQAVTGKKLGIDDAYTVLGLAPGATEAEVKAAWRRLAARWHPDRNDSPQALHKMQRINQALEEIRRFQPDSEQPQEDDPARKAHADPAGASSEHDGHDGSWNGTPPEQVLHLTVALTLEEAALGCIKELHGEVEDDCLACEAVGYRELAGGCPECGGEGRVRRTAWFGWLPSMVECEACGGEGTGRQVCACCQGRGKSTAREYRHRVRIPAGVRDGDLLHVANRMQQGAGPQDNEALELRVELLPHAFFELDADGTVRCELPVDGFAWIANRWTQVPTLTGLQQMRLNRGHLIYRLKGQGFPAERAGPRGDCLITVKPLFPQQFDPAQDALLDRLIATNSGNPETPAGRCFEDWVGMLQTWQRSLSEQMDEDSA